MSANFSHDRAIRLGATLVWNYFNDFIKKVTLETPEGDEKQFEAAIKEDLRKHAFMDKQVDSIMRIFNENLIGESILESINADTLSELTAYLISLENSDFTKIQLTDYLRDFGIDSISKEADGIVENYERFAQFNIRNGVVTKAAKRKKKN